MNYFIITIDTEGDNLWEWRHGNPIYTENTKYLSRFQELCEKFGFKPVWLSNFEMLNDSRYVKFIKDVVIRNAGECGMHLHAWNTPPYYDLPYTTESKQAYLIEYPYEIMEKKIKTMTQLIIDEVGVKPVSHRAGRWSMNEDYFNLLIKNEYCVDCSVTPGISWKENRGQTENSSGSDYSKARRTPYFVDNILLEVPVSVMESHKFYKPISWGAKNTLRSLLYAIKGQKLWVRPNGKNINQMLDVINFFATNNDYVMFMLHSSELMPGGSPTFKTRDDIELLYVHLERLFSEASKMYRGITLKDYYKIHTK